MVSYQKGGKGSAACRSQSRPTTMASDRSNIGFPAHDLLKLPGWKCRGSRYWSPETELEYDSAFDVWHWRGRSLPPLKSLGEVEALQARMKRRP